jgi:hypothetical protein
MSLGGLRQRNRAMSEVDVFTTSEKQLRDLAASFSRLRLELQFGARLPPGLRSRPMSALLRSRPKFGTAAKCRDVPIATSKEVPVFAVVSAVVTDDTERGKARYITPPYGLRADGPLMTGGCVGAASGAGIRF